MRTTDLLRIALAAALSLSVIGGAGAQGSGVALGGDAPVEIESDRLEVMDRQNMAVFTGNVVLVQGELLLRTMKLTVHYKASEPAQTGSTAQAAAAPAEGGVGGGTEVDRMVAEGKVYIDQAGQVVTGDRGEFEVETGFMVVTGNEVVLSEGTNVVTGCRFTMDNKTGQSRVDSCPNSATGGRVKMLLQPGSTQP
jgi:lipopolysaccharide export system protein LptA